MLFRAKRADCSMLVSVLCFRLGASLSDILYCIMLGHPKEFDGSLWRQWSKASLENQCPVGVIT